MVLSGKMLSSREHFVINVLKRNVMTCAGIINALE